MLCVRDVKWYIVETGNHNFVRMFPHTNILTLNGKENAFYTVWCGRGNIKKLLILLCYRYFNMFKQRHTYLFVYRSGSMTAWWMFVGPAGIVFLIVDTGLCYCSCCLMWSSSAGTRLVITLPSTLRMMWNWWTESGNYWKWTLTKCSL